MALQAGVFNVAKGKWAEYVARVDGNDPAASELVIILYSTGDTYANMIDFDSVAAINAGASVESNFTNYVRVDLTDTGVTPPTVNDTTNKMEWDLPDQTPLISGAGGTLDEDIDQIVIAYDPTGSSADSALIPLFFTNDDAAAKLITTNGSDLNLTSPSGTAEATE